MNHADCSMNLWNRAGTKSKKKLYSLQSDNLFVSERGSSVVRLIGKLVLRGDWPPHVLGGRNEGIVNWCECVAPRR